MATSDTTLDDNAAKPAKVKTPTAEVFQHPLPDQIATEQYLAAKAARKANRSPLTGMRCTKVGFPGMTSDT